MKIKTYDAEGKLVRVKRFPNTLTINDYNLFVLDHKRRHPKGYTEVVDLRDILKLVKE